MKRSIAIFLCLLGSASAFAETPHFVNADNSNLSELCLAATESVQQLHSTATDLGLADFNLSELACNGVPWERFVKKYRNTKFSNPEILVFSKTDSTIETELCFASVTSEPLYQELREAYLSDTGNQEKDVLCNSIPLRNFANKYKAPNLSLSLN